MLDEAQSAAVGPQSSPQASFGSEARAMATSRSCTPGASSHVGVGPEGIGQGYARGVATSNANKRKKHGKQKPGITGNEKKIVATNRRARRDFSIIDTYECGMVLRGSEVKSLREANVQMGEAYGRIDDGEMWLLGLNISPYASTGSSAFGHVPDRHRKLLLHRTELTRIEAKVQRERLALVALSIYFIGGRAKVEIGLAKGKKEFDRRQDIARRDSDRDTERAMAQYRKF